MRERRLYDSSRAQALRSLAGHEINYLPEAGGVRAQDPSWHVETLHHVLAQERPGDPTAGGAWEIACRLVHDYQFAEPGILRALYRSGEALLGRNMLLEGRFFGLRFDMGVRITSILDDARGEGDSAQRLWGWAYRTLRGHLEQGELTYEVIKRLSTGQVEFVITGYSRRAPISNPIIRFGFIVFGRVMQKRFYAASARRLHRLVQAELGGAPPLAPETVPGDDTLILAPSHATPANLGRPARVALPARLRGHGLWGRKFNNESR